MKLKLLDYNSRPCEVEIGDLNDIAKIDIKVISGDEIAVVVYKDYATRQFDSSSNRKMNFYDGEYEIYRFDKTDNLIDKDEFKNRINSYWYERYEL